ncbi:alpha/beta hydrolase [Naumannella halotolerans]|uniref:Acetyl esterase/lipase n=1 Tax=Naumannella halotolerans TaxID=993414 RepID=A0A4R7J3N8_9ACTN|nr:alpha/beta hydrolase [Naumannella halotolerans]TDT30959.1 acetyl esterase/lipase [Naumannella halotolerans]
MNAEEAFAEAVGIAQQVQLPVPQPELVAPRSPARRAEWWERVRADRVRANATGVEVRQRLAPLLSALPGDHGGEPLPADRHRVNQSWHSLQVPVDAQWPTDGLAGAVIAPIDPEVPLPAFVRDRISLAECTPDEPRGTLINVHGGAWWTGDGAVRATLGVPQAISLAEFTGWRVLDLDVRLVPEHPYPLPVFDVLAAIDWVRQRHDGPVVLAGTSSGAHTVAVAALLAAHDHQRPIDGQLLIVPSLDLATLGPEHRRSEEARAARWAQLQAVFGLPEPELVRELVGVSPLANPVLIEPGFARALPPTMIAVGEYDETVVGGELYAALLAGSGVRIDCHEYVRGHTLITPGESRRMYTDIDNWLQTITGTTQG